MNSLINILLVDDEPRNLDVLENVLQSPELRLVRANDANETLLALLHEDFAVIVLDIQMPGMSGIELANLIKRRERTQHIPIIFLTAFYQDEQRMLESYNVGAVDYLTKPANPQVLRSKVAVFVDLFRKTAELRRSNAALEKEVIQRLNAERALRESNDVLEARVETRTSALSIHARRSTLLSELAAELLKAETPQAVFGAIFARIAEEVKAGAYYQHTVSAGGTRLLLEHTGGVSRKEGVQADEIAVRPGAAFEEIHETVQRAIPAAKGIYPFFASGELLGTFAVVMAPEFSPGEAEHRFVLIACDLVAAGMERARLVNELRVARDDAERSGRTKDEFLAALSHELRTPLNPVLLVASEAADNPALPPEVRDQFASIRKNVELEARLIDDLLDITRITRGKLVLDIAVRDVHAILEDAIATVRPEIEHKHLKLTVNLSAAHHHAEADYVRLQQVFWNVLKNAVKFTPEGGTIAVATRVADSGAAMLISVTDSGIGLSPGEKTRVFEAFSQGDHASTAGAHRFGGLGLGLTISRTLIESHHGTITVKSEGRGFGATFMIELPLADKMKAWQVDHEQRDQPAREKEMDMSPASRSSSLNRVLLVEDHEPTRKALELLLKRRHFDVASSASLEEARALAASRPFDVLISDIGLPDGTGFELMQEMSERYGMRGIALTGYGMEEDIGRSRSAGFHVHLTKPILIQSLDKALAELLTP